MNRVDFQQLAEVRIQEATALLGFPIPMPDGAYYLAGYAVECALKACIAKTYGAEQWPDKRFVTDCHTHEIYTLVKLAGLEAERSAAEKTNPALRNHWSIVQNWNEHSRYERHSLAKAQKLHTAVTDPVDGVFPWIKARW